MAKPQMNKMGGGRGARFTDKPKNFGKYRLGFLYMGYR
jgi:hypothetical protein